MHNERILGMLISVSGSGVLLDEADRFDGFKIVSDLNDEEIERKLQESAGYRDGRGHFCIKREWIVAQAPASNQGSWQMSFGKMMDFAATRGWIDTVTGAIRAHVERSVA